jgi:hypothetical protein
MPKIDRLLVAMTWTDCCSRSVFTRRKLLQERNLFFQILQILLEPPTQE